MTLETLTLSRGELHKLVWQTPMTRLAAQFGLSDNGLRKVCRRLEVPCPPAGFWAKKAVGKKVLTTPLPIPRPDTPLNATISPTPEQTGELKQAILGHAAAIGEIAVPERLVRPHPVIAGWIEDHRHRKEDARRHQSQWPGGRFVVPDLTAAERRRHRILHTLFRALEQHGAEIAVDDRRHLFAELSGEKIEFGLLEKSRQVTRPLTDNEKRWGFWDRTGVRTELEPTGRFEFRIRVWIDQAVRKTWLETETKPLEVVLPEIVATFLELAPLLAERARKAAKQAKIWEERQRQLELERQRREQDDRRWQRFGQIAVEWQRAELARALIGQLRSLELPESEEIDGRTLTDWLDWAEARADAADPLRGGVTALFTEIARVNTWTRLD